MGSEKGRAQTGKGLVSHAEDSILTDGKPVVDFSRRLTHLMNFLGRSLRPLFGDYTGEASVDTEVPVRS